MILTHKSLLWIQRTTYNVSSLEVEVHIIKGFEKFFKLNITSVTQIMSKNLSKKIERLLEDIRDTLRNLNHKVDALEVRPPFDDVFVPGTLMSLPEHLKRTMETIALFGEGTAQQVSEKTGRSRAAESDYLNQLVGRGFLKKQRVGREIIFQVHNLRTICPTCGIHVLITARYCSRCGTLLSKPRQPVIQTEHP